MLRTTSHFHSATKIGTTSQHSSAQTTNTGRLTICEVEADQTSSSRAASPSGAALSIAASVDRLDAVILDGFAPPAHFGLHVLRERFGCGGRRLVAASHQDLRRLAGREHRDDV